MDINAIGGGKANFSFTGLRSPAPSAVKAEGVDSGPVAGGKDVTIDSSVELSNVAVKSSDQVEKQRFEQIQRAAKAYSDVFIVSDTRFAIFKNKSGEYITRFTSLKDGSVSYVPERYLREFYFDYSGVDTAMFRESA